MKRYWGGDHKLYRYMPAWSLLHAQWMKRIWTLEELPMSSKSLFIGCGSHCWWYSISEIDYPLFHQGSHLNAARLLYAAHARTTTKEHDHVFALVNISPEIMDEITIDYNQDMQELMIRFYAVLAKKGITILCFRSHDNYPRICQVSSPHGYSRSYVYSLDYEVPIQEFDLPSWTVVDGEHYSKIHHSTSFKNYTIILMEEL